MSIYIARSPYRSQVQSRRRLKIGFPNLNRLFKSRPKRISVVPARGVIKSDRIFREARAIGGAGTMKKMRDTVLRLQFGPATAISGLFVIAILLSLTYLAHFNQVATKGYDLRRLEADRQQLLNQYDIKNMKLAGVKSLSNIISSERVSAMRRPGEITYVRANTALASR
jgi:hypothetical protein